jgi:hypothetical protein
MTTQLGIYNSVLMELGERALSSLSEDQPVRYWLDEAWDGNVTAVDYCLGQGQWKFAKRASQLGAEASATPSFGFKYTFLIPSDLIRTAALCSDERLAVPLLNYAQEAGYWFTDIDPLYVAYISNDVNYGGDMDRWPAEFVRFIEAYLAGKIVIRLTEDRETWKRVKALEGQFLREARSRDALEGPTVFPPEGSWVAARLTGGRDRDRGSRSKLIG